jgi:hypothetical protein
MNRRTHSRHALRDSCAYLSQHRVLIARAGDLSASGAFLHTQYPDPVGTRASLDFDGVSLAVEVVRVCFDARRPGMGVAFVDVPRDIHRRLIENRVDA